MTSLLYRFAGTPDDSEQLRLQKLTSIIISGSCCLAGLVWTLMYYLIFGMCLTTVLPLIFVLIVGTAIIIAHIRKQHLLAVYAQIFCIIYVTSAIQWSIGGVFDSGFVMAWAFVGPMTALTFFSLRQSAVWFAAYFLNILITVAFDRYFSAHALPVSQANLDLFYIMNIGVSSTVVFIFASFFVRNMLREEERANALLLNVLPKSIASSLKRRVHTIAQREEDVSILFADIVGFTVYSGHSTPEAIVRKLDTIFRRFDELTESLGLEKIKTIGDAYMVAGGIPERSADHRRRIALLALAMQREINSIERGTDSSFTIRVGIHAGPVVAGVIGQSKFAYDLWGDTVNIASRMESSCEPSKIHVSEDFRATLEDVFVFVDRGTVEIKGKGSMRTSYLLHER